MTYGGDRGLDVRIKRETFPFQKKIAFCSSQIAKPKQLTLTQRTATIQENLFRRQVCYAAEHSPFYKDVFSKLNIRAEQFELQHLSQLPFTTKEDIQFNERAFLCVPQRDIIEHVTTSGTLGSPVTFMLTENDLGRLATNEYQSLCNAGVTADDIIQIMVTLDKRFMAGMAYYLGARKLGAGIVRTGVESLAFQLDTLTRMQATVLIAVPSFLLKMIEYADANVFDLKETAVRKVICIGEPIRRIDLTLNTLGERIKKRWNIDLQSTYASTEMATAFTECENQCGGHELPELIVAELLDADGNPVEPGQAGELVVTPLGIEGMPLLRFRTGDVCRQIATPCGCGRTTRRLGPVEGRKKQMIKLKGTSLYPPAIFDVLNGVPAISKYIVTLYSTDLNTDDVLIEYCLTNDEIQLEHELRERFRSYIRVVPRIAKISRDEMRKKTTDPMSRKPITLLDLRTH